MKTSPGSRLKAWSLAVALVGTGLFATGGNATGAGYETGRKLDLTVKSTSDRTLRASMMGARQVAGDILVRVRVVRQGFRGAHLARAVRVSLINERGEIEHSAKRNLSRAALNRRGAGSQWLTLSLPHEMSPHDTLQLTLDPTPSG
jgi:hypothetical protein